MKDQIESRTKAGVRSDAPTVVRYGELRPCKTAFIDAHTPGSRPARRTSRSSAAASPRAADQHVHIAKPRTGSTSAPRASRRKCRNSLHSHRTAEVFFVLSGRWRFFWGRHGARRAR